MSEEDKKLLAEFHELSHENKAHILSLVHATRSAQETTRKEMSNRPAKSAKKRRETA
jgi:hypothetical protein